MFLLAVLVLPFAGSFIAALLRVNARNAEAWLAGAVALTAFCLIGAAYPNVTNGGVVGWRTDWVAELGLAFVLRLDGFAWAFAMLITGIGFLVVLYARYYMSPSDPVPRFFSLLLAFMGAMLGIVLSGNLLQLVFFWELTSLFSFLLISYWHHNAAARDGARMALVITSTGGLCLFAGVLLIGHIVGSYDLEQVLASGNAIRSHALYVPALVLILLGALTKSAQFPFHFWLPHAMAAPTPVSAYLHSATMVKAGVFLLVRLWPAMGGTNEWLWLVGSIGLITFFLGAFLAVFQQDLKGLLAYSTISHLGLITLLTGLDTPFGQIAAIFHIMNHATFKASLFMAAGIIDHETGTRDIRRLSGLWAFMPITATLAMVAAAAMAGVPLLNGFLSKEMFFAETIEVHDNSLVDQALPYIVTLASTFTVAYSLRFIRDVFFGPAPTGLPRVPHEPPLLMRLPAELLVLACLIVGVAPALTVAPILDTAARAVLGSAMPEYSLRLWHGITPELLMSIVAMAGGLGVYVMLRSYLLAHEGPPLLGRINGKRIFDWVLVTLSWRLARWLATNLGTRRLQPQLRLLAGVAFVAALLPLYASGLSLTGPSGREFDLVFGLLWVVGVGCAVGAAVQAKFHRVVALILLGTAGLVTCVSFVWLSAPDVALTQIVVETVTTVLLLLGLRWLPKRIARPGPAEAPDSIRWHRVRDFSIALLAGLGLATLALAAMQLPDNHSISRYFVENAYTKGGRNQRGERHPGGFSRVRYARRDHRACGRRTDRLCAFAPFPSGPRKHSRSRTAACPGCPRRGSSRSTEGRHCQGHACYRGIDDGAAVSRDRRRGHFPSLARARPSGRRLRRRHRNGNSVHPAVYGSRYGVGGSSSSRHAGALDGFRPLAGRVCGSCRLRFRTPLPDLVLCICRTASARSRPHGQRSSLRYRCVLARRRRHGIDAHRNRASIAASLWRAAPGGATRAR